LSLQVLIFNAKARSPEGAEMAIYLGTEYSGPSSIPMQMGRRRNSPSYADSDRTLSGRSLGSRSLSGAGENRRSRKAAARSRLGGNSDFLRFIRFEDEWSDYECTEIPE
jgi:hypothetical protein